MSLIKCEICEREFENYRGLSSHIKRKHIINSKEYYNKYLKKENEGICPECGKETNFYRISFGYRKFCSEKCAQNSNETRKKFEETCLKTYGEISPSKNKKVREKTEDTNIKKYGFKNVSQNPEIKEKIEKTFIKKYNCKTSLLDDNIILKGKLTMIDKYGEDHPSKMISVKNKKKLNYLKKYIVILNEILNKNNLELLNKYTGGSRSELKIKCKICKFKFTSCQFNLSQGSKCPNCFPKCKSIGEIELSEFIKSVESSEIIENSRKIINPYELDAYIPDKNIAIEFDGLYWHSEYKIKDKRYHLNKTELCKKKNIQLIHIFEDEWMYKKDIVKSRLKQLLNINTTKRINVENYEIKEIDSKIKNEFLNKHHIQGEDKSNVKLGAFYNSKLISVMTLYRNIDDIYELSRLCLNFNYHIPEISSKLLEYFKNNYQWKEIYSYVDRGWFEGNLYYKIGFELDSVIEPNYWYIKGRNRIHGFNLRKKPNEPKDIPEWILRSKEGYHRIWDCGHYKFKIINRKELNKYD